MALLGYRWLEAPGYDQLTCFLICRDNLQRECPSTPLAFPHCRSSGSNGVKINLPTNLLCPLLPTTPSIFEPIHHSPAVPGFPHPRMRTQLAAAMFPSALTLPIRRTRSARELVNLAIVLPRRITGPFIVKTGCSHPSNHTHTPSSLSLFCLFHLFFPPFILVQPCECTPSLLILALVL